MLKDAKFAGSSERAVVIARFLVKNEITKPLHLQYCDHPSEWVDASEFEPDELQAVWNLRHVKRTRSRHERRVALDSCVNSYEVNFLLVNQVEGKAGSEAWW